MRWEEMPKGHTAVEELVKQFETHCRLEGKPDTTCRWYREILGRCLGAAVRPRALGGGGHGAGHDAVDAPSHPL